jgi:hypothetical protein
VTVLEVVGLIGLLKMLVVPKIEVLEVGPKREVGCLAKFALVF